MRKSPLSSGQQLKITLRKSPIGFSLNQKRTTKALGLRRLNQTVTYPYSPAVFGMAEKIKHLIDIETVEGSGVETE